METYLFRSKAAMAFLVLFFAGAGLLAYKLFMEETYKFEWHSIQELEVEGGLDIGDVRLYPVASENVELVIKFKKTMSEIEARIGSRKIPSRLTVDVDSQELLDAIDAYNARYSEAAKMWEVERLDVISKADELEARIRDEIEALSLQRRAVFSFRKDVLNEFTGQADIRGSLMGVDQVAAKAMYDSIGVKMPANLTGDVEMTFLGLGCKNISDDLDGIAVIESPYGCLGMPAEIEGSKVFSLDEEQVSVYMGMVADSSESVRIAADMVMMNYSLDEVTTLGEAIYGTTEKLNEQLEMLRQELLIVSKSSLKARGLVAKRQFIRGHLDVEGESVVREIEHEKKQVASSVFSTLKDDFVDLDSVDGGWEYTGRPLKSAFISSSIESSSRTGEILVFDPNLQEKNLLLPGRARAYMELTYIEFLNAIR